MRLLPQVPQVPQVSQVPKHVGVSNQHPHSAPQPKRIAKPLRLSSYIPLALLLLPLPPLLLLAPTMRATYLQHAAERG
jgi:hypothetical protein